MNAVLRIFVWLLALSVVALPVVAVVNGWVGAERWPLAKLRVHGEFKRVPAEQLQQVLLPYAHAGFFAVKLQDAQDALEQLPWVESAQVRKQWPDVLEVTLVEHKPFARWGNDRLVSEQGKLFPTPKKLADLALPELDGPDSQTEEVMKLYSDSRALFAPAGVDVPCALIYCTWSGLTPASRSAFSMEEAAPRPFSGGEVIWYASPLMPKPTSSA